MSLNFYMRHWETMGEPQKRSLYYLRGLRDRIAEEIKEEVSYIIQDEKAEELIEEILGFRDSAGRAGRVLKVNFQQAAQDSWGDKVDVLLCLVRRIARLEREACGIKLSEELQSA